MSDEPDIDNYSYFPSEIFQTGWSRWMPANAIYLFNVIGTATVATLDGSLAGLCSRLPVGDQYPDGPDTPLMWQDPSYADDDPDEGGQDRVELFNQAVAHLAPAPTTVGEYAHVLAQLGVFTHTTTADGVERWRVAYPMPLPTEVLRLPDEVAAEEDRIRWWFSMEDYAQPVLELLYASHPERVDTTIERFARECDMDPEACRQGLLALVGSGELVATRMGQPADVERLPVHARVQLEPQWETLAENRVHIMRGDG